MKLGHVAVAVRDLTEASRFYGEVLGLRAAGGETVEGQKVSVAFFDAGGTRIELVMPTSPDSPISKYLESRGPGIHHICLEVDDLEAEMERLRAAGARFIDDQPRPGSHGSKVAFLHPKSAGGVLIELSQPAR